MQILLYTFHLDWIFGTKFEVLLIMVPFLLPDSNNSWVTWMCDFHFPSIWKKQKILDSRNHMTTMQLVCTFQVSRYCTHTVLAMLIAIMCTYSLSRYINHPFVHRICRYLAKCFVQLFLLHLLNHPMFNAVCFVANTERNVEFRNFVFKILKFE